MYLKPLTWLFCIMCTTMMPKRIRSISVCHIFCRYCLLQTEKTRKKNLKLSNFKSGKKWWWANWSLGMHGINRGFIQFNSLSFTGSFFLIFHFVFFLFLNAVVNRLSHFIQIWKNLPQLFSRRCEERRLILVVNLEGKKQNKNMLYCHLIKAA